MALLKKNAQFLNELITNRVKRASFAENTRNSISALSSERVYSGREALFQ